MEVESRHEKGSADLEARTRGEERVGGVGGSGNAGGSGPVQDFTWLLSSSAMSSFVEKHLIRQDCVPCLGAAQLCLEPVLLARAFVATRSARSMNPSLLGCMQTSRAVCARARARE
jgi:hypothetical protein